MPTVASYTSKINEFSSKIEDLKIDNPGFISDLTTLNSRIQTLKTSSVNHVTSLIPSISTIVTQATSASGLLGQTLVSCPLFNEYLNKLEQLVDSTILNEINNFLNSPIGTPIADIIVNTNNAVLGVENLSQDITNRTLDIKNKFNNLIQNYVNMVNMLSNPCKAVTYLANSQLVGELNPSIQNQANNALSIVEDLGGSVGEITSDVQKKIASKAVTLSGILT